MDATDAPVSPDSDSQIAAVRSAGGWGNGDRIRIDFGMTVLHSNASTQMRQFTPNDSFFLNPDCDHTEVPVPIPGNIEGEEGYQCTTRGDCHLIVLDDDTGKLYEMWKANIRSSLQFDGGCLAIWDVNKTYGEDLRGDQCASADGAGFPIAPLLFDADEVAAGSIDHAIRFVLPNDRVRQGFVRPATHAAYTSGDLGTPYYGSHFRLRADYPIDSLPSEGAKVVARAMQKYGMYHADGGEYALTATSDRFTTAKWEGLLGADDLAALTVEDFEIIDHGDMHDITNDCMR
ncbi:MAG: hypothetical protein HOV81_39520 [Kofleriaceae bacterium]|nr:hypothetical protein [Kofleriaceae bacterium]